jgi:fructose-bisphosphate aldolase class I
VPIFAKCFSFGRALQAPAMSIWRGSLDGLAAAQEALYHRARCNSIATGGNYSADLDQEDTGPVERPNV